MARSMVGVVASVAQGVLLASASAILSAQLSAGRTPAVRLVGAGDIPRCDSKGETALPKPTGGEENGA
jgi:hypothetical protein